MGLYEVWMVYLTLGLVIVGLGQLLFIACAYKAAGRFLDDHNDKLKLENRNKIIVDSMMQLSDIRVQFIRFYRIEFGRFDDSNSYELEHELNRVCDLIIKNQANYSEQISKLNQVVTITTLLNDSMLRRSFKKCLDMIKLLDDDQQELFYLVEEHATKPAYELAKQMTFDYTEKVHRGNLKLLLDDLFNTIEILKDLYNTKPEKN